MRIELELGCRFQLYTNLTKSYQKEEEEGVAAESKLPHFSLFLKPQKSLYDLYKLLQAFEDLKSVYGESGERVQESVEAGLIMSQASTKQCLFRKRK